MKLTPYLLGVVFCTTLLFVSCKKNDLSKEKPAMFPDRVVNGVIADDPALLAKVPMIISSNYLASKMQGVYLAQAKGAPPTKGPKGNTDVTAPSITITSPVGGSSFTSGAIVNVAISASDNVSISSESFSVDGTLQVTVSGTTSGFSWSTTNVASGTHTLTVSAKDAAGNIGSASIVVTVNTTVIVTPPPPPPSSTAAYQITMPPVTSQGSEGSCVSFAVGYNARSVEDYYKNKATGYSYSTNILSPEYLFDQTKSDPSNCTGSTLLAALNFLQTNGICTWQSMPYSSTDGCYAVPTAAQNAEAYNYRISTYSMLYTSDISGVKQMLDQNHPLVITFEVDSYFYYAGPGFIWKSYSPTLYGRHAGVICGYDDAKHAYKFANSWGTGWGDGGYTWIDYDFLPTVSSLAVTITL